SEVSGMMRIPVSFLRDLHVEIEVVEREVQFLDVDAEDRVVAQLLEERIAGERAAILADALQRVLLGGLAFALVVAFEDQDRLVELFWIELGGQRSIGLGYFLAAVGKL